MDISLSKRIFVNGTFDILHPGHVQLLNYAKSLGDSLTVGIDSDRRVAEKKGPSRPVNNVSDRAYMLQSLKAVDYVVIFDSDEQLESCIKTVKPDIMVVGSDWKGKEIVGGKYAKKIVYFDRIGNYSTTNILEGEKA